MYMPTKTPPRSGAIQINLFVLKYVMRVDLSDRRGFLSQVFITRGGGGGIIMAGYMYTGYTEKYVYFLRENNFSVADPRNFDSRIQIPIFIFI